jgi:hypothetical protein
MSDMRMINFDGCCREKKQSVLKGFAIVIDAATVVGELRSDYIRNGCFGKICQDMKFGSNIVIWLSTAR